MLTLKKGARYTVATSHSVLDNNKLFQNYHDLK